MPTELITVLLPAHNEAARLPACIDSLAAQTRRPDRIVVIADNCTDGTEHVAMQKQQDVFITHGNMHAKAGGLNQWLDAHLSDMNDSDLILVIDADGQLDPDFIENALRWHRKGYAAVGGVFRAEPNGTFVGFCQANEYARYRYLLRRSRGKTLVLTGTATLFDVELLKQVRQARDHGWLPSGGSHPETVYSIRTLVEDLELTLAIKHLDHKVIAPIDCSLTTEAMGTWGGLARQRYRWKLGALQTAQMYGIGKHTNVFHRLQIINLLGIVATVIYLATLVFGAVARDLTVHPIWIGVTVVYMIERMISVNHRGPRAMLVAVLIIPEMIYDIALQMVQLRAIAAWIAGRKQLDWYEGKAL